MCVHIFIKLISDIFLFHIQKKLRSPTLVLARVCDFLMINRLIQIASVL